MMTTQPLRYHIDIYTDASYCSQTQTAVGGYLLIDETSSDETRHSFQKDISSKVGMVQTHRFGETSNIRAEFRSLFYAMNVVAQLFALPADVTLNRHMPNASLTIFTDCQAIEQLPGRRNRLERRQFKSQRTGRDLSNKDVYQTFFSMVERFSPEIIWVKGHLPQKDRSCIHRHFHRVDKATRLELRSL